jgi:hypothetical protein
LIIGSVSVDEEQAPDGGSAEALEDVSGQRPLSLRVYVQHILQQLLTHGGQSESAQHPSNNTAAISLTLYFFVWPEVWRLWRRENLRRRSSTLLLRSLEAFHLSTATTAKKMYRFIVHTSIRLIRLAAPNRSWNLVIPSIKFFFSGVCRM